MRIYKTFINRLLLNYLTGTLVAVIASAGGFMILTTLRLSINEYFWLLGVLAVSIITMLLLEFVVFMRHMRPVRQVMQGRQKEWKELQKVYFHVHRLPVLAVLRILIPHFIGLSVPAVSLTLWLIRSGKLNIPDSYMFFALVSALSVVLIHSVIEFYLTTRASVPIIQELRRLSREEFDQELSLDGLVLLSIRRKFRWGAFMVGIFPLMIYSLVVQFLLGGQGEASNWEWAGYILLLGLILAYLASWLLTREVESPIQNLYEAMAEVKAGNLQVQAEDLYSDEFSKLVLGFNHMMKEINAQVARNNQLVESYFSTLAAALDARDPYTAGHSQRVAEYATHIGMLAGLPDNMMDQLRKSALLHDIGKIGTRDSVLLKDGKLTDEEFNQIKQHPAQGENILRQIEPSDEIAPILPGVRSHHERYDGKGYPDSLHSEEIPLFGRIIAVADAFDAMTSDRPYRQGMDTDTAMEILEKGRGTQWDPYFAGLFIDDYKRKRNNSE